MNKYKEMQEIVEGITEGAPQIIVDKGLKKAISKVDSAFNALRMGLEGHRMDRSKDLKKVQKAKKALEGIRP